MNLSKTRVNKAGDVLRAWVVSGAGADADVAEAAEVMLQFRALHQYPLAKTNMGLRSVVRTEGCRVEVSQRLKRVPTILDKLHREPKMALSRMQDIGGCRAVVDTIAEVRRVEKRLKKNRPPLRYSDYITNPRSSGYRGVHIVVCYDERAIEVQLRTTVMHEWAITVERLGGQLQSDLKSGKGPAEVNDLFQAISEAMAIEETGGVVPDALLARIAATRTKALPFLRRP